MDSTTVTKPAVHAVMTANHVNPKLLTNSCQRRQLRTSGLNPVSGLSQDASIEGVTVTLRTGPRWLMSRETPSNFARLAVYVLTVGLLAVKLINGS